jgi:hypothetical protein
VAHAGSRVTRGAHRRASALAAALVATCLTAPPAGAHGEGGARAADAADMASAFLLREPVPVSGGRAVTGAFSAPFVEPTIDGRSTDATCVEGPDGRKRCKPAAGTMTVLASGRVLYWNALEGTDSFETSIANEYGTYGANDQTRVLTLGPDGPRWAIPQPEDGGANPDGYDTEPLIDPLSTHETHNDGALFCSDQIFLPDGRVLASGGTAYYYDPGVDGVKYGISELEGLRSSRIFDPATSTWSQTGEMHVGRWYPTLVELGDGKVMVASGVQKLVKPVYPTHPQDSGRNVTQTETYDPETGRWSDNGASARRSLPLYPRLHLLPNGHVFYAAAGQAFNPFGQAYDELSWNEAASYDPAARTWRSLGIPGLNTSAPGFRGSTFSTMLPLRPDALGRYTRATFLAAGGVLFPSPGSYFPVRTSTLTTVDTGGGGERLATRETGPLGRPRWYSTAVVLPTGEVIAFSGADRDEVDAPGVEFPERQAEMFDPQTETWHPLAAGHRPRTYHNTAALLPDGSVLVGGHAPLPFLYTHHRSLPGPFAPNERDPSFEIYHPPYLFRGPQPVIRKVRSKWRHGKVHGIRMNIPAADVRSVMLMRNTSLTHLVDANQRAIELPVLARRGRLLLVAAPPDGNVAPPGPYTLFVNRGGDRGLVPSRGEPVSIQP